MEAYKTTTTVRKGGSITLKELPFPTGERVEVTVHPAAPAPEAIKRYPLRGTHYRYDRPLEPVAEGE